MYYLNSLPENNDYILIMDRAYFPYGNKSKEFLIKRTLYFCNYLFSKGVDYVILACNTLSYITLPFIKDIYPNVYGVFEIIEKNIKCNSVIIGSKALITELSKKYYDVYLVDGSEFINNIEKQINYCNNVEELKKICFDKENLLMACTHFLGVKASFKIEIIKNDCILVR